MKIYRMKIKPKGSHITPWHSDTLFGSLCWVLVQKSGDCFLREFLNEYKEGRFPVVISNGFPGDYLPKPMAGNVFPETENPGKYEEIAKAIKIKEAKKTTLISLDEFNSIINNQHIELKPKDKLRIEVGVMHNQISRMTDTTIDGGLFEQHEVFWEDTYVSIYFGIKDEWKDIVEELMHVLAVRGYGKRASAGKGHFSIEDFCEFKGFNIAGNPNSFVCFSNYIPCETDPVDGQYSTFVKHGKLGQYFASCDNPFKKPILMINPGAVFWDDNPGFAYGRLAERVSVVFPEVVHCGCSLAIPSYITKPDMG
jgi:CRISPR-associated protein Csm4